MGKNIHLNWFLKYALNLHTDAFKSSSKRAIQRTTKGTSDLMWNKIADKVTKVWKTLPQINSETVANEAENIWIDREIPKERYIFPKKRLRLI